MRITVPHEALYTRLPPGEGGYLGDRYAGEANPAGSGRVTRPAGPRTTHPRLNTVPWPQSMAVQRTEPGKSRRARRKARKG